MISIHNVLFSMFIRSSGCTWVLLPCFQLLFLVHVSVSFLELGYWDFCRRASGLLYILCCACVCTATLTWVFFRRWFVISVSTLQDPSPVRLIQFCHLLGFGHLWFILHHCWADIFLVIPMGLFLSIPNLSNYFLYLPALLSFSQLSVYICWYVVLYFSFVFFCSCWRCICSCLDFMSDTFHSHLCLEFFYWVG